MTETVGGEPEAIMTTAENLSNLSNLTVAIPEHVLFQHLEGEAVLLDVRSGGYFGLNEVGSYVWQQLTAKQVLPTIVEGVCGHFEVKEATAAADVKAFLTALQTQGLVIVHEQTR